jgi:hypothetical protein
MIRVGVVIVLLALMVSSCSFERTRESNLTQEEITYLHDLKLLDDGERILMFESNGGLKGTKTSGNFYTNARVASYWVDGKNDKINSAFYSAIDSIKLIERTTSLTYASYLEIEDSSGHQFEVYIDADSARVWSFFQGCVDQWVAKR